MTNTALSWLKPTIISCTWILSIPSEVGYALLMRYGVSDTLAKILTRNSEDQIKDVLDGISITLAAVDASVASLSIINHETATQDIWENIQSYRQADSKLKPYIIITSGLCLISWGFGSLAPVAGYANASFLPQIGIYLLSAQAFLGQMCLYIIQAGRNPLTAAEAILNIINSSDFRKHFFTKFTTSSLFLLLVGSLVRGAVFAFSARESMPVLGLDSDMGRNIMAILAFTASVVMNAVVVGFPSVQRAVNESRLANNQLKLDGTEGTEKELTLAKTKKDKNAFVLFLSGLIPHLSNLEIMAYIALPFLVISILTRIISMYSFSTDALNTDEQEIGYIGIGVGIFAYLQLFSFLMGRVPGGMNFIAEKTKVTYNFFFSRLKKDTLPETTSLIDKNEHDIVPYNKPS